MEGEDKCQVQPPGGEVCHACGTPYPNRNPSAKMRRNHRKHCVKPEAVKDEELSGEEQPKKEGVGVVVEESSERDEEGGKGIEQIGENGEMGFVGSAGDAGNLEKESNLRSSDHDNVQCALLHGDVQGPIIAFHDNHLMTGENLAGGDGVDCAPSVHPCKEKTDCFYHHGSEANMIDENISVENTDDLCTSTCAVECDDNAIDTEASVAKGLDSSVSCEEVWQTDPADQLSENVSFSKDLDLSSLKCMTHEPPDPSACAVDQTNGAKNSYDTPVELSITFREISVHNAGSCHDNCSVNQIMAVISDSSKSGTEKNLCPEDKVADIVSLELEMNQTADENSSLQDKIENMSDIDEQNVDCNSINGHHAGKSPSSAVSDCESDAFKAKLEESRVNGDEKLSSERENNLTDANAYGSHIEVSNVHCGAFYNAGHTSETFGMKITGNNFDQGGAACNGCEEAEDHKACKEASLQLMSSPESLGMNYRILDRSAFKENFEEPVVGNEPDTESSSCKKPSDELGSQSECVEKNDPDRLTEYTVGDANDNPSKLHEIANIEVSSGRTEVNHENQDIPGNISLAGTESSEDFGAVDGGKNDDLFEVDPFDHHDRNSPDEHPQECAVGNKSDQSMNKVASKINNIQNAPSKESESSENSERDLASLETKHFTVDGHDTLAEMESYDKKYVAVDDPKSDDLFEFNTSFHSESEQESDFCSAKEEHLTVSDRSFYSIEEKHDCVPAKEKSGEICADRSDTMSLPSISDEIHPVQNMEIEVQGMKKNEEITEKNHVTLKILLAEANLESNQKPKRIKKKSRASKDEAAWLMRSASSKSSSGNNQEWNSPARLPGDVERMKRGLKERRPWVPFMCCPTTT